ncbi:tRNA (guanosine(46)-N7)-methyltransferase TrmB [Alkalihalobacillus oceani]|uniref:tRNA (guanosine(46)-N7)-methyltransferase TrmB n=1 Tax=Halalkalibacter oceani TaxID=1653776 RepID=UPI00203B6496|nr:tRNA (guanosine(46)-N7)-methyltransferase TrmB [Halalkalibacter oceani]MCM3759587.1 tRNA (guanosine(46)-N7)-methyltransferase TrmB [Halalkalibacter oceani]
MRLRHKPWASGELERHPEIVIPAPAEVKGKWKDIFRNDYPIHVEVGTGKGKFVTGMSALHPDVNYIGIEKYDSVIITALERVKEAGRENVKLLKQDVSDLLDFFAEGEIDRIYINFTDPWPKKKHAKRRLTHEGFLQMYQKVLKPEGEIHFKTDNQKLFEFSLESFANYGMKLQQVSLDLHASDFEGNVMTEYEQKFSAKGMRIYRCEAKYRT